MIILHKAMKAGLLLGTLLLLAGCATRQSAPPATVPFPSRLEIPSVYSDPGERAQYVADHYWNAFFALDGPCDSTRVNGVLRDEVEQAFGTFVTLLETTLPLELSRPSLALTFDKAAAVESADTTSTVFVTLDAFAEKYLYDPNSPVRNEDLYGVWAGKLLRSPLTDPLRLPSLEYTVRMCSLNAVGSPAADFSFTDLKGRTRTLYGVKAEYTVLFFSNPGCPACHEIVEAVKALQNVEDAIAGGRLAIVNVYIDEEVDKWLALSDEYPRSWVCGYDPDYIIRSDVLYNVRAIPSLYLLDKDKKVLLKDAPQQNVIGFLSQL